MHAKAFTLLEILVVVAIISILAAIAIPNYTNAQTRAKISRTRSDLHTFDVAILTYILDHNKKPPTHHPNNTGYNAMNWWGFLTPSLTTPVAYMTQHPPMVFNDPVIQLRWQAEAPGANSAENKPCTYVRNTYNLAMRFQIGDIMTTTESTAIPPDIRFTQQMFDTFSHSGYVLYSCGPDSLDSTCIGVLQFYDPTNGTNSFGDLYHCGAGSPEKPDVPYQPGHG